MKKRTPYILAAALLLAVEIIIGVFVHDNFIRPYVGDVLVTTMLCCMARCVFPDKPKLLALWVFIFGAGVELLQLAGLDEILGLEGTAAGIILGSTFDIKDIFCYLCGCVIFFLAEKILSRPSKSE